MQKNGIFLKNKDSAFFLSPLHYPVVCPTDAASERSVSPAEALPYGTG